MGYQRYRDLKVYRLSYELAMEIFEISKQFPSEERFALRSQILRSSRSVPANLAEAWLKRRYIKSFITKIIDSSGEAGETEVWLSMAKDAQYIDEGTYERLVGRYQEVLRMLNGMITKADKFCYGLK